MNGGRQARRTGLLLGASIALGAAIWLFPNPGSVASNAVATTGPASGSGAVLAGGLATPAQSALDQVLGSGRSVVTASAMYGPESSGRSITYDPQHLAVVKQSQVTAPGYQGSVTDNGVSRAETDSTAAASIQRISVAVVVDSGLRPAPKLATIRKTVTAALSLQPRRGDTISVTWAQISAAANVVSRSGTTTGNGPSARTTSYLPSAFGVGVALVLLLTLAMDATRRRARR